MDINVTLIIQMLVFAIFVWFTMKFVWPPLAKALEERQEKIAAGLSAAERGRKELELAQHRVRNELKQAKMEAAKIIEKAAERAAQLVEEARKEAEKETRRQAELAQKQLSQEVNRAKDILRKQIANLAVVGAETILKREVDKQTNHELLDNLIEEI